MTRKWRSTESQKSVRLLLVISFQFLMDGLTTSIRCFMYVVGILFFFAFMQQNSLNSFGDRLVINCSIDSSKVTGVQCFLYLKCLKSFQCY